MSIRRIFILLLGGLATLTTFAGTPGASFAYQGVLKDSDQVPLHGSQTVTFRLYGTPAGDDMLWGRQFYANLDANGLFNIEICDNGPSLEGAKYVYLRDALLDASTSTFYLGLTVSGSSGEIRPRQRLLAVPFATVAGDVSNASGNLTVAAQVTSKSLSTGKIVGAGEARLDSLIVQGTTKMGGKLTVEGGQGASIGGSVDIGGATSVGGDLTMVGDIYKKVGNVKHQLSFIKGMIIMWSGTASSIPAGWYLCNGSNGTPDLRNRFIVGAGSSYSPGAKGGADTVALSVAQMPSHYHTYASDDNVRSVATQDSSTKYGFNWDNGSGNYGQMFRTSNQGGGAAHENRPPYYALCFIMYVGQ